MAETPAGLIAEWIKENLPLIVRGEVSSIPIPRKGDKGDDGNPGTGIALIEQRDEQSFHITLDDGREFQIDLPDPKRTTVVGGGGGGGVRSIVQGTGVIVDNTDPRNPIISAIGGGGGGIALPAGQTITAYQVVTTNLAGDIVTADAGTVEHQGRVIGVALNSAITGATVAIADSGVVTNAGWSWTPHAVLYVGLNGTISTEQVGAFSQNLGYSISATEIFIRLGRSVVRG